MAALPDELKALRQWVVWRYEARPGKDKPAKRPYSPRTGRPARTDGPATWGTWPQALARYQHGGWEGLGFVFTAADPYCGIDLDDCRDPATGEIAFWAQQIVDALESYTEISPSGRGLHILVKAALPDHVGRKQGAVEVYDALRYFAVTGERLAGTPASLEERQAETLALYATLAPEEAEELPERAVVPGGKVGFELWLRRDERQHLRAARAEGGPGHGRGRGVAGGGEVRPGRLHAGRERLLAGVERGGEVRVGQVEQVLELGLVRRHGGGRSGPVKIGGAVSSLNS